MEEDGREGRRRRRVKRIFQLYKECLSGDKKMYDRCRDALRSNSDEMKQWNMGDWEPGLRLWGRGTRNIKRYDGHDW